jgi:cold-inducible RNA-binding protein
MSSKLYVGNISFNATEETLTNAFSQFGTVNSCKIIMDRDTGRSKGFGFIEMGSGDEAQKAIDSLDGQDFDGRQIRVNVAKEREPRNNSRW